MHTTQRSCRKNRGVKEKERKEFVGGIQRKLSFMVEGKVDNPEEIEEE